MKPTPAETTTQSEVSNKPLLIKPLLWLTFSGTAMLSAFILPVHVWALMSGNHMKLSWLPARLFFFVLFGAALYHGLYRTKTILFDLGVTRGLKVIGIILSLVFVACLLVFALRLFL